MELHQEVQTVDEEKPKKVWKGEGNIPPEHKAHQDDIIDKILELENMWGVHLGLIRYGKNRIKLTLH